MSGLNPRARAGVVVRALVNSLQGQGALALLYDARIKVATAPVLTTGRDGLPRSRAALDAEVWHARALGSRQCTRLLFGKRSL